MRNGAFPTGRDGARPLQREREWTDGGVRSPRPTEAALVVLSNEPMYLGHGFRRPNFGTKFGASVMGIGPYALWGDEGRHAGSSCPENRRNCPGQRCTAERLRRDREGWVKIGAEIIPKRAINSGQSLSHGEAVTAPFTQGSLGDGGCGLPRRFAPRNDNGFLSFRGGPTGRRGNPSFLRWTGVRAAVPRAWPPPTKFRPEIWGVSQVVGPYEKEG